MKFPSLLFHYILTVYANGASSSSDVQFRIAGGSLADIKNFPYQVGLWTKISGERNLCGGSLLSPTSILTAAHCFEKDGVFQFKTKVKLGASQLDHSEASIKTKNVVLHPSWDPRIYGHHDLAMVHIPPKSFKLSDKIKPIRLPTGSELQETFVGENAVVSGYGITYDDDKLDKKQKLYEVTLRIISNTECQHSYPDIIQITNGHICTSPSRNGPCLGDSGGPLVVHRNGEPVLVGVMSFGSDKFDCPAEDVAEVYSRVPNYIDWINDNLTP